MNMFKLFCLLIIIIVLTNCHSDLPDLIISNIISYKINSNYYFDVTIQNTGTAIIDDTFYLYNSRTQEDYDTNKFYTSRTVNQDNQIIDVDDTITVTTAGIDEDIAYNIIRFVLVTNKTYFENYLKPGTTPNVNIIESDYSNNFSEITIY